MGSIAVEYKGGGVAASDEELIMLTVRLACWYRNIPQTAVAMRDAWKMGKDFQILCGPYTGAYVSIRDIPDQAVKIRFNFDTDFVIVSAGGKPAC